MSDSEFDIIPDPFTSVTDAEWSRLLGRTNLDHDLIIDASPARSTTSTHYSDENLIDMNMSALAELDRIEASALQSPRRPSPQGHPIAPSDNRGGHYHNDGTIQSRYFAGDHLIDQPVMIPEALPSGLTHTVIERPKKRPRSQASTGSYCKGDGMTRHLFEAYEEELTCPICCDLFVSTHAGNPCGHSYCGDCGWQWIKKSSQHQCPVCRAKLTQSRPLIPNIVIDSLVEKHIAQLNSAGDAGWRPQGFKFKERTRRKERWKASVDTRTKAEQTRKTGVHPIITEEFLQSSVRDVLVLPSDDDSSFVDSSSDGRQRSETVISRRTRSSTRARQR